jgi:hypothetical protein
MAYYTTDYINAYRNYEAWAAHEASVKPIRGRDVKPLARRRDWHMSISRDGDDIVLREHHHWDQSLRVVYCKDGTMKLWVRGGALYHSSQRFFFATTGVSVFTRGGHEWIDMGHGSMPVMLDTSEGVVTFKRNPENTKWVPAKEGSTGTHYVLNRKAFNAVKKRVQPYMAQLEIFLKLKAEDITLQRQRWFTNAPDIPPTRTVKAIAVPLKPVVVGHTKLELCKRCMESSDVEDWYEAHQQFLLDAPYYGNQYYALPYATLGFLKLPENVISYAWEQVKHIYRDEIFEEKPNTKPSHMRDTNKKYFK